MKRYNRDQRIAGGKLQSAQTVMRIRRARELGLIQTKQLILTEDQRLDHLAHEYLGNSTYWWILAALSDIGWGLQIPAGTIINIPTDLAPIRTLVG